MTGPFPTWADWQDRAQVLGLRMRSGELVGPCPSCGGTDRFHVRRRGPDALVGCRGCIDGGGRGFGAVLRAAFPERGSGRPALTRPERHAELRAVETGKTPGAKSRAAEGVRCEDSRRFARRIWRATRPLAGTVAESYLDARGVGHVAGAAPLRFAPVLTHPAAPGRFPCLVAGIQDVAGQFLGIQRTYIAADGTGKASVQPVRASLGSLAGGAVRLAEPAGGRLLVGEGIESTAAAVLVLDWHGGAWATLGTSGLRTVELPEHVRHVTIAADRDAKGGGQAAAAALAERLEAEGRRVSIHFSHDFGEFGDFADALAEPMA